MSRFKLDFLTEAPVIIVVAGDPKKTGADQFCREGEPVMLLCCAAIQNMHLALCTGSGQLMVYSFRNR